MILFASYLLLSSSGVILMKIGADHPLSISLAERVFSFSAGGVTVLGLCCYICSFLIYTRLIALYDITYLVPIASAVVQVIVVTVALLFLGERLTLIKACGIAMVLVGALLMNLKQGA